VEVYAYLANLELAKRPHKTIVSKRCFLVSFLNLDPYPLARRCVSALLAAGLVPSACGRAAQKLGQMISAIAESENALRVCPHKLDALCIIDLCPSHGYVLVMRARESPRPGTLYRRYFLDFERQFPSLVRVHDSNHPLQSLSLLGV
jgi:hypothetical protein